MNETLDLKLLDIGSPTRITETTITVIELVLVSSIFKFLMHPLKNVIQVIVGGFC